jgi:DNA-binding MarR family transcriptional regulator
MSIDAPLQTVQPVADSADLSAAVRLADVVGRLVRMLRRSSVGPLAAGAMSALATVVRQGPVRLGELAEREGMTPATLSRIVTMLEREQYVERRPDPADRRAAFLSATPRGEAAIADMSNARAAALAVRIAQLSSADQAALAAGLDVVERLIHPVG